MSLFPPSVLERVCPHCVLLLSASAQSLFWLPEICTCSHKCLISHANEISLISCVQCCVNMLPRSYRQELAFVLSHEGRWSQVFVADLLDMMTVIYFSDCWWCGGTHCPHHK